MRREARARPPRSRTSGLLRRDRGGLRQGGRPDRGAGSAGGEARARGDEQGREGRRDADGGVAADAKETHGAESARERVEPAPARVLRRGRREGEGKTPRRRGGGGESEKRTPRVRGISRVVRRGPGATRPTPTQGTTPGTTRASARRPARVQEQALDVRGEREESWRGASKDENETGKNQNPRRDPSVARNVRGARAPPRTRGRAAHA